MTTERLNQAIRLINEGKRDQARELILQELRKNPDNLHTWLWALEIAVNDSEKRSIIKKILIIDPGHKGALAYLNKLDQKLTGSEPENLDDGNHPTSKPHQKPEERLPWLSGMLGLVADFFSSLPSGCGFFALFILVIAGVYAYTRVNTSFFGLAGADLDNLVISNSYELISSDEFYWQVQFEGFNESKYIGIVRHASPIRIKEFSILTHDILVTTGDYANPDKVNTNVVDHKFFWSSPENPSPTGSINLIHAVPANKTIYQQLLEIQKWDTVKITGREIFSIKAYQGDDSFLGTWMDTGCNTLLVESVSIIKGTGTN